MTQLKSLLLLLSLAFTSIHLTLAQNFEPLESNKEGSIFWEVSGNGLKEPSYLFGTLHLLTSSFVDSLPLVIQKFNSCKTFAGEMKMDSSMMPKMQQAAYLQGTTLDKLMSPADYDSTAKWLKELSGYDLSMFNQAKPITVSTILTAFIQQSVFPQNIAKPEPMMDAYFQELSEQSGKEIIGLETIDDQIHALYDQFTYERQAELLIDMVKQKDIVEEGMLEMLNSYKNSNLTGLMALMYDETFTEAEAKVILDYRNQNWMKKIPSIMEESSLFVAVGALHLYGENGLVELLRNQGYIVKPLI